jgi:hypothetical protein
MDNNSLNQLLRCPTQLQTRRCKTQNNSREDCNKFSILLESKRYCNNNDEKNNGICHGENLSSKNKY